MSSTDPNRPNIIFVLSDDQGPWALGSAGNDEILTPNLDQLAASGTRLARFFCASPVCSPARASLLTGQPPSGHGVHDYLSGPHVGESAADMLAGQRTYTDVLADNGYRLGLSGKWHLGANEVPRRGFVHWFALEAGSSPYFDAPMWRDGRRVNAPGYVTDVIADDAISFIQAEQEHTAPFFLSVNFTAPHSPWAGQHPEAYTKLYEECEFATCPQGPMHQWTTLTETGKPLGGEPDSREALVGYFASITAMDEAIGRILISLDETNLREHTLVVFSSDNGFNAGHHGIWGKGNGTWPLNMYDSSVIVPTIIAHPGRVAADAVRHELLSAYDMAATLLELANLDPSDMEHGPGRSFADLLMPAEDPDVAPVQGRHASRRVVVFDEYGPARMIRTEDWKYVHRWPDGPHELYDLRLDPDETRNLVDDPLHAGIVIGLRQDLVDWFKQHVNPARDGERLPVIGTGQKAPVGDPKAFQGPLWRSVAGQVRADAAEVSAGGSEWRGAGD